MSNKETTPAASASRPTCDCGRQGQWWGDGAGLRMFACPDCAQADPNLPEWEKPLAIAGKENPARLLPCPFCDSEKITIEWEPCPPLDSTDTNRRWFAECSQCSCQGPFCQKQPQVVPAWNNRADPAAEIAALREALCAMMSHSHMLAHLHRVKKFATPDVIDFAEEDWQSARELLAGKAVQS